MVVLWNRKAFCTKILMQIIMAHKTYTFYNSAAAAMAELQMLAHMQYNFPISISSHGQPECIISCVKCIHTT